MKTKYLAVIFGLVSIGLPLAWSAPEPQLLLTDDEIRQKIVGTWLVDNHLPNGNSLVVTETVLSTNSMTTKAAFIIGEHKEELEYSSTWQVKDGYLITTVTKSNSKDTTPGEVAREKVVTLNENIYVFHTESGKTITEHRSK